MLQNSKMLRGMTLLGALSLIAVVLTAGLNNEKAAAGGRPSAAMARATTDTDRYGQPDDSTMGEHESVIHVADTPGIPVRKRIKIGAGKGALVEFPRPVKDVVVTNPGVVDATVMSSNRVFLMGRKFFEASVFFFDESGEQFATFDVYVERDMSGLESLLRRTIPGSHIHVEAINNSIVLTGSVRNPIDSNRAAELAFQFAHTDYDQKTSGDQDSVNAKQ